MGVFFRLPALLASNIRVMPVRVENVPGGGEL